MKRLGSSLVLVAVLALSGCKGGGPADVVPPGEPPAIDPEVEAAKRAKAGLDGDSATPPPRPPIVRTADDGTPWIFAELDEVNAPGRGPGRDLEPGAALVVHGHLLDPYASDRKLAADLTVGLVGEAASVSPDAAGAFQLPATRQGTLALTAKSETEWAVTRVFGPDFTGGEQSPLQLPIFDATGYRRLHEDLGQQPDELGSVLLVRVLSADLPPAPAATVSVSRADLKGYVLPLGAPKAVAGFGVEGDTRTVAFINVPAGPIVIDVQKADGTACPGPGDFELPPTHVYIADFVCP